MFDLMHKNDVVTMTLNHMILTTNFTAQGSIRISSTKGNLGKHLQPNFTPTSLRKKENDDERTKTLCSGKKKIHKLFLEEQVGKNNMSFICYQVRKAHIVMIRLIRACGYWIEKIGSPRKEAVEQDEGTGLLLSMSLCTEK